MKSAALRILLVGSAMIVVLRGQEIDTVMFREREPAKRFTIIDQIADPRERHAFLKLYGARDPRKRRKLAEEFAAKYPQSWLLAQVYEIGAKACIDVDDYAQALRILAGAFTSGAVPPLYTGVYAQGSIGGASNIPVELLRRRSRSDATGLSRSR
jgi:hypothetical protein